MGNIIAFVRGHPDKYGRQLGYQPELPTGQANQMMRMERLDGIGPARYGELNQLEGVTIKW
ncbi:hypothetical protein [Sinorhizobium arboris]|uniref:hypothetical protein n=1 Tax=Sinorhizobium arboris TaxID=76745 RepID=UPI0003F9FFE8|nr:hypothetical protein [Sinorhizobium arboris]